MKRGSPKRDWSLTHDKVSEGCRICGNPAERAHIIGREFDKNPPFRPVDPLKVAPLAYPWAPYLVHPDRIVPLCGPTPGGHHGQYDRGELDLLPYLTLPETLQAVADAGSLELARKRLAPSCYRESR